MIWRIGLQQDEKIIAAGQNFTDFAVVRYQSNGSRDSSFGTNGIVLVNFSVNFQYPRDVAITPAGKIYVAGYSTGNIHVLKLNSDGSLDTTFNHTGKLTINLGNNSFTNSIALQPDGKLILGGGGCLIRLEESGAFDSTFNSTGVLLTDTVGAIWSIALQSDGKIVAGGTGGTLARFNPDGSLDTTFSFQSGNEILNIKIQQDGKILAAGYSGMTFALACYNSDGSNDVSFGNNGVVLTSMIGSAIAYEIAILFVFFFLLGGATFYNNSWKLAMARYFSGLVSVEEIETNNGVFIYPNPSFGTFKVIAPLNSQFEIFNMLGEKVFLELLKDENVHLNVSAGIYFVKVSYGERVYTQKLVIQ